MEEIRDCKGRLVSVADASKGVLEYTGTGKVQIYIKTIPGCTVAIEKKDAITYIERTDNKSFTVHFIPATT